MAKYMLRCDVCSKEAASVMRATIPSAAMTQCPSFAALCTEIAEGLQPGFGEAETNNIGRMIAGYVRDPCQPAGHVEWEYEEKRVASRKRRVTDYEADDEGESDAKREAPPAKRHARFEDKCGCSAAIYEPRRTHAISVNGSPVLEARPERITASTIELFNAEGSKATVSRHFSEIRVPHGDYIRCPPSVFAEIRRLASRPMTLTPNPRTSNCVASIKHAADRDSVWRRCKEWPALQSWKDEQGMVHLKNADCHLVIGTERAVVVGRDWHGMLQHGAGLVAAVTRCPIDASAFVCESLCIHQELDQRAHEHAPTDVKWLEAAFPGCEVKSYMPEMNVVTVQSKHGPMSIRGRMLEGLSCRRPIDPDKALPGLLEFFEESALKIAAGFRERE